MSRAKSLPPVSWQKRIAALSDELATLERAHRGALESIADAAGKVAAGGSDSEFMRLRKDAERLAEQIGQKRTVLAAAQRAKTDAEAAEAEQQAIERDAKTLEVAAEVNAAAAEVERLVGVLNAAVSNYIDRTSAYGDLTGRGRDQFHPESRGKVRLSLQGYLRQNIAVIDVPGSSGGKQSELLKPAVREFLS